MTSERVPSTSELMCQASVTASRYMQQAVESIDEQFGAGYAKANPELVAAFMQSASIDFLAGILHERVVLAIDAVADRDSRS